MDESNRSRWLAAACFAGLFVWLLWDVLLLPNNFAFRDAAHFYYPLYEFVEQEWDAGRVPLWNPYENNGEPLLANSTTAVLYPGKLIFRLPIDFAAAFKAYVLIHLLLAGGTAWLLARRWGGDVTAAALCAMSYAFSGQILFQVTNVVFLCAAAWLPLVILAGDAMLQSQRHRHALALGAVLSLMIFCGDPQLAYEAGLLVALGAILYWRAERTQRTSRLTGEKTFLAPADTNRPLRWYRWRPALLAAAAVWSAVLSAIQVLPTAELSRLSDRAHFDLPRSIAEIPSYLARDFAPPHQPDGTPHHWFDAMIGKRSTRNPQHFMAYRFSLVPLRVAEWMWPNFSGQMMPVFCRWLSSPTKEGPLWTPSIYMGLFPFLLAVSAWRLRGASPRIAWLSWMALLGTLGAFGMYGLGWVLRQTIGSEAVPDEIGGLYWLLTVVLPGFVQFRFPTKLLTLAALGLSGLAAAGWQQLAAGQQKRLLGWVIAAAAASLVGLLVVGTIAPRWNGWLAGYEDDYFGPLQTDLAYWGLVGSLLHTLLLAGLFWALLRSWRPAAAATLNDEASWRRPKSGVACAFLLLTTFDLAVAQKNLIVTAPSELWSGKPALAQLIEQADPKWPDETGSGDLYRLFGVYDGLTADFTTTSSPDRSIEGVRRERAGMQPKYGLPERYFNAMSPGTIDLYDYSIFTSAMIQPEPREYTHARRALDALGAKYFLLPTEPIVSKVDASSLGVERQWLEPRWTPKRPQIAPEGPLLPLAVEDQDRWFGALREHVKVVYNHSHLPRVRIVRDLVVTESIPSADRNRLQPLMEAMLFPFDNWIDLRTMAWVEEEGMLPYARDGRLVLPPAEGEEICRVVRYEPQRVEIEAELATPGLVVLSDIFYPGWQLTVETDGQRQLFPIVRTNRVMRGALLPAGKHRLVYAYRPARFYWGAAISAAGWLAAACVAVGLVLRGRRRLRPRRSSALSLVD